MRLAVLSAVALALAACTKAEMSAAREDPNGFACRQRAVVTQGVPFEETAATRTAIDASGAESYAVGAAGRTFRCTLDAEGFLTGFAPA